MGLWSYFLVFSGGAQTFYGSVHGQAGRWTDTTAWIYSGIHLSYPALALMIVALIRDGVRSKARWIPPVALFAMMLSHAILIAGRGPFFQLTVTAATAYMLARRKRIRPSTSLSGIVLGALLVVLLVGYREAIFLGTSVDNLQEAEFFDMTDMRAGDSTGNEFAYHTAVLTTVDRLQQYGWGEKYVWHLLLHPIPRIFWSSKPYDYGTGSIDQDDILRIVGWEVGTGAAAGLVADWYREWGAFSIAAWCVLGSCLGLLYRVATTENARPLPMILYALALGRSLHLFGQGFPTFLDNILIMVAGMYLACWMCGQSVGLRRFESGPGLQPCSRWCKHPTPTGRIGTGI
jgi:oligosaccharide repeat unit polymerase